MKIRGIVIGFEKRNVEYRVKTREVGRKTELVNEIGELALDGEGSETDMVEFVGGTGGLDVTAEEPNELVGLVGGGFRNVAVVVLRLTLLREFEVRAELVVDAGEVLLEVGSCGDVDRGRETRRERGVEAVVGEERGHLRRLVLMIVVGELGEWKEIDPVVLIVRNVRAEVRFEGLIGALGEPVGLRVICGRVLVVDLELSCEFSPEA